MAELTEGQRSHLASALAYKLSSGCWDAGVEQVAREVDGGVVIYPWKPGKFNDRELEVIQAVWSVRGSSQHVDLVIANHPAEGLFTKATP